MQCVDFRSIRNDLLLSSIGEEVHVRMRPECMCRGIESKNECMQGGLFSRPTPELAAVVVAVTPKVPRLFTRLPFLTCAPHDRRPISID